MLLHIHIFRPVPADARTDALFLSVDATPLRYSGLAQISRRLGKASCVHRLHAHLFRHTFSVRYLMNSGDMMTLRTILGHASIEVTQMYLQLVESHVQVQHLVSSGRSTRHPKLAGKERSLRPGARDV